MAYDYHYSDKHLEMPHRINKKNSFFSISTQNYLIYRNLKIKLDQKQPCNATKTIAWHY